jgi:hypothetical protein
VHEKRDSPPVERPRSTVRVTGEGEPRFSSGSAEEKEEELEDDIAAALGDVEPEA